MALKLWKLIIHGYTCSKTYKWLLARIVMLSTEHNGGMKLLKKHGETVW